LNEFEYCLFYIIKEDDMGRYISADKPIIDSDPREKEKECSYMEIIE
jgi:hypothetical protein